MTRFPGYTVVDEYLDAGEAASVLAAIEAYLADHELPIIHREHAKRGLHYGVIDGTRVHRHLPDLERIYRTVNETIDGLLGSPVMPLRNEVAALNVNVTPPGGSYRWHYDRNAVTATLYLNCVEGGELEVCPNYRVGTGRHPNGLTRQVDRLLQTSPVQRLFGHKVSIAPRPGALVIMRGNRCLHSVSPVTGREPRVNLVMAFDDVHGPSDSRDELDRYLYSAESIESVDPNYRR